GARVFRTTDGGGTWQVSPAPLASGQAAGVFSLTFLDARRGVAVGGDYTKESEAAGNVAVTDDGGRTWRAPRGQRPAGYRSAVARISSPASRGGPLFLAHVAVGPAGSDYSIDDGESWTAIGPEGFHAVSSAGYSSWAVGEGGRIAQLVGSLPMRRTHSVVRPAPFDAAGRTSTRRPAPARRDGVVRAGVLPHSRPARRLCGL
ncbi:MAG: hypothetical protein LC800_21775, partial [Acidobacteria bacterium]|nr:hypothetical protein [Acidobacteriota bacterium]